MTAIPYRARAATRRARRRRDYRRGGVWTYVFLLLLMAFSLFPLYWSFVVASHDNSALGAYPPVLTPGGNFRENVDRLFNAGIVNVDFAKALINSAIVASVVTASVVFFCTLAGYAFAKLRFRGRGPLLVFVIMTMAVPAQLGVVPLFILMAKLGWAGTLGAVVVPWLVTAFGVFFMRQYLVDAVPDELIEAARIDGWALPDPGVLERRRARRTTRRRDPLALHVHDGLDRLLLAADRAPARQPHAQVALEPGAAERLTSRTTASCSPAPRWPRCRSWSSSSSPDASWCPASCKEQSRDAFPEGFSVGRGDGGVPDRGRGGRGRPGRVDLGPLLPARRATSTTATPATRPATTTTAGARTSP